MTSRSGGPPGPTHVMSSPAVNHLPANLAAHQQRWGYVPQTGTAAAVRVEEGAWTQVSIRSTDGRWIRVHGDQSPADETAAWLDWHADALAQASTVCVIGPGLGEVIAAVATRLPAAMILALEPEPALLGLALARHDWTASIAAGRLMLLAGPDYDGRAGAWRMVGTPASPAVLVHPIIARERTALAKAAAQVVGQAIAGARANAQARERFAAPYLLNTLRNLSQFTHARDVRACAGRHAGHAAVVAGAGPSLNRNLAELAALDGWRERAVLVAVDTALKPVLAAGMTPHYVVGVDPGEANARTLRDLPALPDTWLVAEASLDPCCFAAFHGRTTLFRVSETHEPWPWLAQHGVSTGLLRAWGSVLTTAYDFALHLGCDPVVFIGADLAYTDGQPYCRDTIYEERWAAAVATGLTLPEIWQRQLPASELVDLADLQGGPTQSSRTLVAFRDWLAAQAIAGSPGRVVNATGRGILVGPGISHAPLAQALAGAPVTSLPADAGPSEAPPLAAASQLAHAARQLVAAATSPRPAPLPDWQTFTAGRASIADAVGAALDAFPTLAADDPALGQQLDAHVALVTREADDWARRTATPSTAASTSAPDATWRTASPGDRCFGPIPPTLLPPGPVDAFRTYHALQLNARRLEHLASLGLALRERSVLEVGAGVGDLTDFFLDRGCVVRTTDARRNQVAILARRFAHHPLATVAALDLDPPPGDPLEDHEVVFCYGVLYHLSDPAAALDYLSAGCRDLLLLDTIVGPDDIEGPNLVDEDPAAAGAAVSGRGSRPSRSWVHTQLQTRFAHVYVPISQPNHFEYPVDWSRPSPFPRRAIFVASRRPLSTPQLSADLLARHQRH